MKELSDLNASTLELLEDHLEAIKVTIEAVKVYGDTKVVVTFADGATYEAFSLG